MSANRTTPEAQPLVTFALLAYNQERFIREAVEGAFAQTYSPLEIILSDDCSQDDTFVIMQTMVAEYKGPHKIILNQNSNNLGIGFHLNHTYNLSAGDWIFLAARDDVSLPNRVSVIMKYISNTRNVFAVGSGRIDVDESGRRLESLNNKTVHKTKMFSEQLITQKIGYITQGCSMSYSRACFKLFEPLQQGIVGEDMVLPFRSGLLGGAMVVADRLVIYRYLPTGARLLMSKAMHVDDPHLEQMRGDVRKAAQTIGFTEKTSLEKIGNLMRYYYFGQYITMAEHSRPIHNWRMALKCLSLRKDLNLFLNLAFRILRWSVMSFVRCLRVGMICV
jgi:glycosyltransferase involved in cell wall biosynthesis